ncbi:MAG: OmpA family protein [Flavipsychrobacter sp.]|nr:OmpA family protein [Flavipsychrobacter sp.]
MKQVTFSIAATLMIIMALPSCVAKRKYVSAQSAAAEQRKINENLQASIARQGDTINMLRKNVNALGDAYQSTNSELNMSKDQIADQQRRLAHLQSLINQQQSNTEALRKKIADALVNFNTNELTVYIKDGKVYVSMTESLLFPSGSAEVNQRGKDALAKLAGVLNTNPDINVNVEGHTDTVPIKNKVYMDNWALSVGRSTAIARILIGDYTVPPARIIASGRGEHHPVAPNTTDIGRAQNRRTEIILEPKLDALMDLIHGVPVAEK